MAGLFFEDFHVGDTFSHANRHTITEEENLTFCTMTQNNQPLHIDKEFAAKSSFGRRLVNGLLTMGLVVGLSVEELTEGTIVANLGYEAVRHPAPVYHGDTISAESEVLSKRESKSKPDRGIVRLIQTGRNQDGKIVVELERTVLVLKK
jgi:acyl dehydratase